MSDKVFLDGNIFLYALDTNDQSRRAKAKSRLRDLSRTHRIIISTQVLNEVYAAATERLDVEVVMAKRFVQQLSHFDVVLITPSLINAAIDCSILNQLNYWDALMIAAAESAKCPILWTEDMKAGERVHGVTIINPLT